MASKPLKRGMGKKIVVTLFCLSGATAAGYFLYLDYFGVGIDGNGKRMATLEQQVSSVRRKPSTSFMWSRARSGQTIFRRDSILVGPGSSAALRMEGDSVLEVGENSLIVLDDLTNLSLNFMRGAFIVRGAAGDKTLLVDGKGKVKTQEIKVRLLTPAPQTNYFASPNSTTKVSFRWKALSKNATKGAVSLQVSADQNFSVPVTQTYAISDPNAEGMAIPLYPGNYYWRLRDDALPVTETRRLVVATATPIKTVWPSAESTVEQWGTDGLVQFRWVTPKTPAGTDGNAQHRIEVARDASFKEVFKTETVSVESGMVSLPNLPEGTFFWRLVSVYGDQAITAPAQKITLRHVPKIPMSTITPEESAATSVPTSLPFQWDCDHNDAEYTFELEKTAGAKTEPVLKARTRSRSFTWKQPVSGVFRWKVSAANRGQIMGETEWKTFTLFPGKPVTLRAPGPREKLYYWEQPVPVEFAWEGNDEGVGTSEFLWELSHDFKFKHIILSQKTKAASLTQGGFGTGIYFWRVKLLNAAGKARQASEPSSFEYGVHPILAAPISARPKAGITISVQATEADPSLEWDAVPQATAYEISLRAAQVKSALSEVIKETSFALKGFSAGKYNWSVKAIDKMGRRGEAMPWREFTLHFGPLPAPKSVVSEVQ